MTLYEVQITKETKKMKLQTKGSDNNLRNRIFNQVWNGITIKFEWRLSLWKQQMKQQYFQQLGQIIAHQTSIFRLSIIGSY